MLKLTVFESIRYRLLLSYLGVLAAILLVFAIAVRMVFAYALTQKQVDELRLLAKAAAATANFSKGQLSLNEAFAASRLTARNEALQWFDIHGAFIGQSGKDVIQLPLTPNQSVQVQERKERVRGRSSRIKIIAVTLTVFDDAVPYPTGYVRASQSLEPIEAAINRLDWGLGAGSAIALILSGIGGVWLTKQSMRPVERSFERLKQFTADASHELRSPLMAIQSNAQVALKYPEGMREKDAQKFDAIASAAQQMKQLTEDLLFLARTDKLPNTQKEPVNLSDLLAHLVQLYQPHAEAKQIQLESNWPDSLWILGNPTQLNRLFTNLVINALQYTPSGGKVSLRAYSLSKYCAVDVEDTGIGIPPDQLDQVFDRFWRAEESRSAQSGGSGLGLAIAQAIAKNHGGSITVTSQVGVGSCFIVKLGDRRPADRVNSEQLEIPD